MGGRLTSRCPRKNGGIPSSLWCGRPLGWLGSSHDDAAPQAAEPWSDSLTATPGQRLTVPDSLTALTAPTASDSNTRQLRQHLTATEPLACQTCTRQHPTALTAPDSWSDRGT